MLLLVRVAQLRRERVKCFIFSFRIIQLLCFDSRVVLVFDEIGRCHEEKGVWKDF